MGEHNIMIVSLPAGVDGTMSAATTASSLLSSSVSFSYDSQIFVLVLIRQYHQAQKPGNMCLHNNARGGGAAFSARSHSPTT